MKKAHDNVVVDKVKQKQLKIAQVVEKEVKCSCRRTRVKLHQAKTSQGMGKQISIEAQVQVPLTLAYMVVHWVRRMSKQEPYRVPLPSLYLVHWSKQSRILPGRVLTIPVAIHLNRSQIFLGRKLKRLFHQD